jgi:hypothetical protein
MVASTHHVIVYENIWIDNQSDYIQFFHLFIAKIIIFIDCEIALVPVIAVNQHTVDLRINTKKMVATQDSPLDNHGIEGGTL